ncbi:hypothetical protein ACFL21_05375, partial [Patescibacteria group bacterium]
ALQLYNEIIQLFIKMTHETLLESGKAQSEIEKLHLDEFKNPEITMSQQEQNLSNFNKSQLLRRRRLQSSLPNWENLLNHKSFKLISDDLPTRCSEIRNKYVDKMMEKIKPLLDKSDEFTERDAREIKELLLDMWHNMILRISTQIQNPNWDVEEPGGIYEESILQSWPLAFKEIAADYLKRRGIITNEDDLVFYNTSGTPADYLSQTDSFFAIIRGPYKGFIMGIDYSVSDEKKPRLNKKIGRNEAKRSFTGRTLFLSANMLKDESKMLSLKLGQINADKKMSQDERNLAISEAHKKFRINVFKKIFLPSADICLRDLVYDLSMAVRRVNSGQTSRMFIGNVDELYEQKYEKTEDEQSDEKQASTA